MVSSSEFALEVMWSAYDRIEGVWMSQATARLPGEGKPHPYISHSRKMMLDGIARGGAA